MINVAWCMPVISACFSNWCGTTRRVVRRTTITVRRTSCVLACWCKARGGELSYEQQVKNVNLEWDKQQPTTVVLSRLLRY